MCEGGYPRAVICFAGCWRCIGAFAFGHVVAMYRALTNRLCLRFSTVSGNSPVARRGKAKVSMTVRCKCECGMRVPDLQAWTTKGGPSSSSESSDASAQSIFSTSWRWKTPWQQYTSASLRHSPTALLSSIRDFGENAGLGYGDGRATRLSREHWEI